MEVCRMDMDGWEQPTITPDDPSTTSRKDGAEVV